MLFYEGETGTFERTSWRANRRYKARLPVGMICGGGPLDPCLDFDSWQLDQKIVSSWLGSEEQSAKEQQTRIPQHFIQFFFSNTWFAMHLPCTTLSSFEALLLMNERDGFFRNADVPDYRISSPRQIQMYDPVCKYYEHDQCELAVADLLFLFRDLWVLPWNTKFFAMGDSFDNEQPAMCEPMLIRLPY